MKKVLFYFLMLSNLTSLAMEEQAQEESFFPENGKSYSLAEHMLHFGGVFPAYDHDSHFTNEIPYLPKLFKECGHTIIQKKIGATALTFYQSKPTDETAKVIDRYAKAVAYRLGTRCHSRRTDADLIHAEAQVPFNLRELSYILYGRIHIENNPPMEKLETADHQDLRDHLNNYLKILKESIEKENCEKSLITQP